MSGKTVIFKVMLFMMTSIVFESCSISDFDPIYELVDEKKYFEAKEEIAKDEYRNNLRNELVYLQTLIDFKLGNYEAAQNRFDNLLTEGLPDPKYHYLAAQIYFNTGNYFSAHKEAEAAFNGAPTNYDYLLLYAKSKEKTDQITEAQILTSRLIGLNNKRVEGKLLKLQLRFFYGLGSDELNELESEVYSLMDKEPEFPETTNFLVSLLVAGGKLNEAFNILTKIVEKVSNSPGIMDSNPIYNELLQDWCDLAYLTGSFEIAERYIGFLPQIFDEFLTARKILYESNHKDFLAKYKFSPTDADRNFLNYGLLVSFIRSKDDFGVNDLLTRKILLEFNRYEVFDYFFSELLIRYYLSKREVELAENHYKKHIQIFHGYKFDNYYNILLQTQKRNYKGAFDIAQKENFKPALERDRKLLAYVYFANGNFDELKHLYESLESTSPKTDLIEFLYRYATIVNNWQVSNFDGKTLKKEQWAFLQLLEYFLTGDYEKPLPVDTKIINT